MQDQTNVILIREDEVAFSLNLDFVGAFLLSDRRCFPVKS